MQPLVFLQNGDAGIIRRVSGSAEVWRFLASLGFVEDSRISVISRISGNLIVNIKDSRIAVNEEMARHILVQTVCPSGV